MLFKDKISEWVALHLPKRVVHWCLMRAWSYGVQGKYSHSDVNRVTASTIVKRWYWNAKGE